MNFYTNVLQRGNNLHVRAVVNGERQNFKVRYRPTLFSPVNQETGYKTLEGNPVLPRYFDMAISYQILNKKPPGLSQNNEGIFYGVNK